MKLKIECPYCDGIAVLKREPQHLTYRKEVFKVTAHFYKCGKCKEEFTTTESDTRTIMQAHNQYRAKHNIPFPEEIISIREKYGLSATKMSEVLGLGVNGYNNYEKGEMPNAAIANLIRTADIPAVFLDLLENAKEYFSENSFSKAKSTVYKLIEETKKSKPFYTLLNLYKTPNDFTGYTKIDADKIANLVIFFITASDERYNDKLKLNKQLFYSDFRHYKNYGKSITGLSYRAINYGPVPANYDNIFTYLENEQIISSGWMKTNSGAAVEIFSAEVTFNPVFSEDEMETIEAITTLFKGLSSWEIVDLSHGEKGWKELVDSRRLISYQEYAFHLIGA